MKQKSFYSEAFCYAQWLSVQPVVVSAEMTKQMKL